MARDLTRHYREAPQCTVPAHALFPQMVRIVDRYLREKVRPAAGSHVLDVFLSPYYGWVLERLLQAIKPDAAAGEEAELPVYEPNRGPGSTADVSFWTSKDVREVVNSHVNYVVADTRKWEQAAAYVLDTDPRVVAFVKNEHLGFAIPYLHNGQGHEYVPDFLVRVRGADGRERLLILETKGYDPRKEVKAQAAQRWVSAVNADRRHGEWEYAIVGAATEIARVLDGVTDCMPTPESVRAQPDR
jgi:type III restriction enzyme